MVKEYYNVLSLFGGMECGRIALDKENIPVGNYYSSEIKPHAIKCVKYNYPDIIHIGDITKIDFKDYIGKIDLLIGGSPCQDFSRANKERTGLDGLKSGLFFKWLEAKETINPKYFLLENVVMNYVDNRYISDLLGVEPIRINSSLVSAQLRDRNYWTNIQGYKTRKFWNLIDQPKDKKIMLQDILEYGYSPLNKARALLCSDARSVKTPVKVFHRFYSPQFTTPIFKDKQHYLDCVDHYEKNYKGLSTEEFTKDNSVYEGIRYFTQSELEALQTVPKGYTKCLTRNQAADLLGDGWTIDIICHLFKGLKTTEKGE